MSSFDKINNKIGLACLLLLLLVSLALPAHAREKSTINIVVVLSKNTLPYQKFNQQLKKTLNISRSYEIKIRLINSDVVTSSLVQHESAIIPDYVVAVGTLAAQELIKTDIAVPIIFSLIPGSRYQNKIENSPYCTIRARCSAIYMEQPIDRQFSIIKQGLPELKKIGIILGPVSLKMQNAIIQSAKKYGIDANIRVASKEDNPVILSQQLSIENDALLAIPDPNIYNRKTAKGILLSSYKYQTPLIAYSHSFVRAGALFSIYSTPEQIATQTANMLLRTIELKTKKLPAPEYPVNYKLKVNSAVMRSLRRKINFDSSILDNQ